MMKFYIFFFSVFIQVATFDRLFALLALNTDIKARNYAWVNEKMQQGMSYRIIWLIG
ncbi:MAG TPA: hypothetical protein VK469_21195 [Candidatus Kapabacteria bacterium]|nr:hypothetical protein [Candidatus Kapabacteria bacterium]